MALLPMTILKPLVACVLLLTYFYTSLSLILELLSTSLLAMYKGNDLEIKTTIISRDVMFHENIFSYHTTHPVFDSSPLVPTSILDHTNDQLDMVTPAPLAFETRTPASPPVIHQTSIPELPPRRYKARFVVKGYNQVEGVDYVDGFSPVAKAVTVRTFLVVASSYSWPIHQVDINNTFFHSFPDEDIYMHAPDGYHVQPGKGPPSLNINLSRTLYEMQTFCQLSQPTGLKLSSHNTLALSDPEPYRRLVGRLLYLSFTRPNISFGAQQLSQFIHAPCTIHMETVVHLIFDWLLIFLGNALISWKTKKQTTVARFTAEAEYRSLGTTVCELQ
ncbi:UNVERIFIED_CONTAM: Retrovirus-related Pol polyprotein from transposon RE1 [Sesamum latifolium]|uniref:Retrovirus-related Pol polyprotein from transposon RE1 n=1 Tax=Sesamum latifolium TaxID=2727402 RepID=A0AAW2WYP8_9LAMI